MKYLITFPINQTQVIVKSQNYHKNIDLLLCKVTQGIMSEEAIDECKELNTSMKYFYISKINVMNKWK